MKKTGNLLLCMAVIVVSSLACQASPANWFATPTPTPTNTPTVTPTPTITPTPIPTDTPTATPSPTPLPSVELIEQDEGTQFIDNENGFRIQLSPRWIMTIGSDFGELALEALDELNLSEEMLAAVENLDPDLYRGVGIYTDPDMLKGSGPPNMNITFSEEPGLTSVPMDFLLGVFEGLMPELLPGIVIHNTQVYESESGLEFGILESSYSPEGLGQTLNQTIALVQTSEGLITITVTYDPSITEAMRPVVLEILEGVELTD